MIFTAPPTMLASLASSFMAYPRGASWANLDDGFLKKSYIVIGVPTLGTSEQKSRQERRWSVSLLAVDAETHHIKGWFEHCNAQLLFPDSSDMNYKIFEVAPGYFATSDLSLSDESESSPFGGFWVKPGSLTYIGDLHIVENKVAFRSSFDALQVQAQTYGIDPARLTYVEKFEPLHVRQTIFGP